MSAQEIRYCVGGRPGTPCCVRFRHLPDCTHTDRNEPDACWGCQPRLATSGWLCEHCHTRLAQWINPGRQSDGQHYPAENSLLWAHRWLGTQLAARQSQAARQDYERSRSEEGPVTALNLGMHDMRQAIEDHVYEWQEATWDRVEGRPMSELGAFDLGDAMAYLARQLFKIEDNRDLVAVIHQEAQETMRDAHSMAPWRAGKPVLIEGIPCPHCDRMQLHRFAGDEFLTCMECRATVAQQRFDQWTAMVRYERGLV